MMKHSRAMDHDPGQLHNIYMLIMILRTFFHQTKSSPRPSLSCGRMVSATSWKNKSQRTLTDASCCSPSTAALAAPLVGHSWGEWSGLRFANSAAAGSSHHLFWACSWAEGESHNCSALSWPWTNPGWDLWLPLSAQYWIAALTSCSHNTAAISATAGTRSCQCRRRG